MVITNSNHKIRAFTDFVSTCDKNRVNEACAHLGSEPEIMNTCLGRATKKTKAHTRLKAWPAKNRTNTGCRSNSKIETRTN
jgi:hypothetical protein